MCKGELDKMSELLIGMNDLDYKAKGTIREMLIIQMLESYGRDNVSDIEFSIACDNTNIIADINSYLIRRFKFMGESVPNLSKEDLYEIYEEPF